MLIHPLPPRPNPTPRLNTKATRTTRPLIEYPAYYEKQFCFECMDVHFLEVTLNRDFLCHGSNYYFETQKARTHYTKRKGNGFELIPMTASQTANALQLDRDIALETETYINAQDEDYIDQDQDW